MIGAVARPNVGAFLFAVVIDALLSMLVFRHADRHGSKHATAWGVFTFLFAGFVVPFYFIRYALQRGGKRS
jgi:hypothetical protein